MPEGLAALLVGCGNIAGGFDETNPGEEVRTHAGAYARHGGFMLAACVESDETRRRRFMDRWKVAKGFASLDECRKSGIAFDVASVCVPTAAHADALEALLAMPVRAVFAEKPLTADLASARRVVAAYAAARRPLAVNYFRRWDPAMADLKQAIAAGGWGGLQSATVRYVKGVANSGSHAIDLLGFLIGPLMAESVFRRRFDHAGDDPTLDALLVAARGAPVYLIGGDGRHYFAFEIDLVFDQGRVVIEDQGFAVRTRRPHDSREYPGYRYLERGAWSATGAGQALVRAVENIRRCLADGQALLSDGESALAAQETCDTLLALAAGLPPEKTLGEPR